MKPFFQLNLIVVALGGLLVTGCGGGLDSEVSNKTTIETPVTDAGKDHGHDHEIDSEGRLVVLNADKSEAHVYDLDDNKLLESFSLSSTSVALTASAGARFALLSDRKNDTISFIDGGLWREDHNDHQHDYKQSPVLSDFQVTGSAPTHISHSGKNTVVFFDGNADAGTFAEVQILNDEGISNKRITAHLDYEINMHGVAKLQGEYLLSTVRRSDDESTSKAKILPDQIGIYHMHGDHFDFDGVLEHLCPDLHGAAQNEKYVAFGCADGVVVAHQHDGHYESVKVANAESITGLRVGSLFGHEHNETLFGVANDRATGIAHLVAINPAENEMDAVDWQPAAGAKPVAYAFSYNAEHFVLLDNQGFLTILEAHAHDGHAHWEVKHRVDITDKDVSTLAQGQMFSMVTAKHEGKVYVADPLSNHILAVDLEKGEIAGDLELSFSPSAITWLGIAKEEEHDHAH